jgi:hypothetical protein
MSNQSILRLAESGAVEVSLTGDHVKERMKILRTGVFKCKPVLTAPPPGPKLHHDIDNTTPARALLRVDSK